MDKHIIKMKCRINRDNAVFLTLLVIAMLMNVFKAHDLPGLYYDAVNPDYMAVHLLNPEENRMQIYPYVWFPVLGNIYYGVPTMWGSLLSILFTGKTSLVQLHFVNGIYGFLICLMMYKVLRELGVRKMFAEAAAFLSMLSPQMFGFWRTQYYMELPGSIFFLASVYFLIQWKKNAGERSFLKGSIFSGLAFYSYFNWLFWIPMLMLIIIYYSKDKEKIWERIFKFVYGNFLGAALYFIGYGGGLIAKYVSNEVLRSMTFCLYIVIYLIIFGGMYWFQCADRFSGKAKKTVFSVSMLTIALSAVSVYYLGRNKFSVFLGNLSITERKAGFFERICFVWEHIFSIISNSKVETMFTGQITSICSMAICLCVIVLSVISIILILKRKMNNSTTRAFTLLWAGILLYYLCSLFFAPRMQPQHFAMFLFVENILLFLSFEIIVSECEKSTAAFRYKVQKTAVLSVIVLSFCLNIINQTRMIMKLETCGGVGKYTRNINFLCSEAIENHKAGKKELYIFPEWGMMAGFNYLTMNEIPFFESREENADEYVRYLKNKYKLKMVVFYDENYHEITDPIIDAIRERTDIEIKEDYLVNYLGEADMVVYSISG